MDRAEERTGLVVHCKVKPFDVYIGRPGPWGNPFSHQEGTQALYKVASREEAVKAYETWLLGQPSLVEQARVDLKGKVLGCWCAPKACHGDVLSRIANHDIDECHDLKCRICQCWALSKVSEAEQKVLDDAWKDLLKWEMKGDEPCDDESCRSCYVQPGDKEMFRG